MASNPLKFAIDRQNQTILTGLPLFLAELPDFFQGDVKDILIQVFDPGGFGTSPTPADMTGYACYVTLGIPGGDNPSIIYAGPLDLIWNPAPGNSAITGNQAGYFTGSLDLTGAALSAALAAGLGSSLAMDMEVNVSIGGVAQCLMQAQISVVAVVNDQAINPNPQPAVNYGTVAENNAAYLRKVGTTADSKIWVSANGLYAVRQYLDNNGRMQFDPIVPPPAAVP